MANVDYMEREEYTGMVAQVLDESADIARRDEALYLILNDILKSKLRRRFRPYAQQVSFTLDDVLQDYFLYLRGDIKAPYAVFQTINDISAFDAWILATFRNYVSKKACRGLRSVNRSTSNIMDMSDDTTQERLNILSTMIAYCYQEFPPVQRFVFLRMVLTYLHKERALPQKDVSEVLGISHVYYRVLNNRVRDVALAVKDRLINGEQLYLYQSGLDLQNELSSGFQDWYDILSAYYARVIDSLSQAQEINALRYQYCIGSSGIPLHDKVDSRCFWGYGGGK